MINNRQFHSRRKHKRHQNRNGITHRYNSSNPPSLNQNQELKWCICKRYPCDTFKWFNCNCEYNYCTQCTVNIINQRLTSLNTPPKCKNSKCNQLLSFMNPEKNVHSKLLPKYRCNYTLSTFNRNQYLITGYIRTITCKIQQIIPLIIITSIIDYYKLTYHKQISCVKCNGSGIDLITSCYQCKGKGYTMDCLNCNATGFWKESVECGTCHGSGKYYKDYQCDNCHGHGMINPECRACHGNDCHRCNNNNYTQRPYPCKKCSQTGIYKFTGECHRCQGNGNTGNKSVLCGICHGSGTHRLDCAACNKSGKLYIQCNECKGEKSVLVLDINKLCQNQTLCIKCMEYHPNDHIIYWSTCKHPFCYKCALPFIQFQISRNNIPKCMSIGCVQELTADDLEMFESSALVVRMVKDGETSYNHKLLKVLIERKNKFYCMNRRCKGKWHPKTDKFMWPGCGHSYSKECATSLIQEYFIVYPRNQWQNLPICEVWGCGHSMTMKSAAILGFTVLCQKCNNYFFNDSIKKWSVCDHSYCTQCFVTVINESLALLNEIPKCQYFRCNQSLSIYPPQINHLLLTKYQCSIDYQNYLYQENLILGYIKELQINAIIPIEIVKAVWDYYSMIQLYTSTDCIKCDNTGLFAEKYCSYCVGVGSVRCLDCATTWNTQCSTCNGTLEQQCHICRGTGKQHLVCNFCNDTKQRMILDFQMIRNKQLLCGRCNQYSPTGYMIYWSTCHHTYCYECFMDYIKKEINLNKIPICTYLKCNQELRTANLKRIQLKTNDPLIKKLDDLWWQKNKFLCGCNHWHSDEVTKCEWPICNHSYSEKCAKWHIDWHLSEIDNETKAKHKAYLPVCKHLHCKQTITMKEISEKFGLTAFCVKCKNYYPHKLMMKWQDCGHLHCHECIINIINDSLSLQNKVPECGSDECSTFLSGDYLKTIPQRHQILILNRYQCVENFESLCDNQSLCGKCTEYHPKRDMVLWPDCCHEFCTRCFFEYTDNEIFNKRTIPKCCHYSQECSQTELTVDYLEDCRSLYSDDFYNKLVKKLSDLHWRKDRFYCTNCHEWELNIAKYSWPKCGHNYCMDCVTTHIKSEIELLKYPRCVVGHCGSCTTFTMFENMDMIDFALCEKCINHYPREWMIEWTDCKHLFCFYCVYKHAKHEIINGNIPQCISKISLDNICDQELDPFELQQFHNQYAGAVALRQYDETFMIGDELHVKQGWGKWYKVKIYRHKPENVKMASYSGLTSYQLQRIHYLQQFEAIFVSYIDDTMEWIFIKPLQNVCDCDRTNDLTSNTCDNYDHRLRFAELRPLHKKLKKLSYVKDKFECALCENWHDNDEKFIWSICNHVYCKECIKEYIHHTLNLPRIMTDFVPICPCSDCNMSMKLNQISKHLNLEISEVNRCTSCNKYITDDTQIMNWTDCKHPYCDSCVANIINQSLYVNNSIPRCISSNCNVSLSSDYPQRLNSRLYQIYQCQYNYNTFYKQQIVIFGYIREMEDKVIFLNDVMLIIINYFGLLYHKAVVCNHCNGKGFNGYEWCSTCDESSDKYNKSCWEQRYRSYLWGNKRNDNNNNDKDDIDICSIQSVMECKDCQNTGKIMIPCEECNDNKKVMNLDFEMLICKQSLCGKCERYYPNDFIFYWPGCFHTFCYECCHKLTKDDYQNGQIPKCFNLNCDEKLNIQ